MARRVRPDEEMPVGASVLWYGYPSPWYFFSSICAGLILLPIGVGLLILLRAYIRRNSFQYVIAQNKVAIEYGYWVKSSRELRVPDIRSINILRRGIPGFFGLGSVEFSSAAHVGANVVFGGVSQAEAVADMVRDLQDEKEPVYVPASRLHSMSGVFALALFVAGSVYGAGYFLFRSSLHVARDRDQYLLHRTEAPPGPAGEFTVSPSAQSVPMAQPPHTPQPTVRTPVTPSSYTPPPAAFAADVKQSQAFAVQRYPELGVAGSPLNRKFLARYQEWNDHHDSRLDRSNWPEVLADNCVRRP